MSDVPYVHRDEFDIVRQRAEAAEAIRDRVLADNASLRYTRLGWAISAAALFTVVMIQGAGV
jgi:hypothetical protein